METYTVKEVYDNNDYWSIETDQNSGFALSKIYGVKPEISDEITLHLINGSFIRGVDINGKSVFYKTDEQLEIEHKEEQIKYKKRKEQEFKKQKEILDKKYSKLPKVFQDRIDRFRKNNPDFRVDYEEYEMFCCEQAVEIAEACKTPEKIQEFSKMNWDEQKKLIKELDDGHSGNSFDTSVTLAYFYLSDKENVKNVHGSLSPLVGSKEYGDVPKY